MMQTLVMLRGFVILLSVVFLVSCQNCICVPSEGLRLGLVSFDSTDVDTIVIRKFEKGNGFSHLIDTLQWDRDNVVFMHQKDTFEVGIRVGDILLKSNYDYKVFIPAINRTFAISELNEPKQVGDCSGKVMCGNMIVSGRLDGVPTSIKHEILYVRK
jgi:hypothetical protein